MTRDELVEACTEDGMHAAGLCDEYGQPWPVSAEDRAFTRAVLARVADEADAGAFIESAAVAIMEAYAAMPSGPRECGCDQCLSVLAAAAARSFAADLRGTEAQTCGHRLPYRYQWKTDGSGYHHEHVHWTGDWIDCDRPPAGTEAQT